MRNMVFSRSLARRVSRALYLLCDTGLALPCIGRPRPQDTAGGHANQGPAAALAAAMGGRGTRTRTVSGTGQAYTETLLGDAEDRVIMPPSEDQIQQLVIMGFPRQRVEAALRICGNDVQRAAAFLLGGHE